MRLVLLLVLLAGCQRIFKLDPIDDVADASADSSADASGDSPRPIDAPAFCWNPGLIGDDDGDSLSDGCDPCPGNPDLNPKDSDGDGIPDVCDPETGHNTIVAFLPLDQLGPHWMGVGQWSVQGTDLEQTDATTQNALVKLDATVNSDTWVQVAIVGPDTPTSANTVAGVYLDSDNSTQPNEGLTCDLTRTAQANGTFLAPTFWLNGTAMTTPGVPLSVVSETWVSARLSTGTCVAWADGMRYSVNAPGGETRKPYPAIYTSFSAGQFKSMTWFSSAI